ncbi:MAG: cobaltochelatase subunit CobN [Novosphingobium sp.]
MRYWLALLFCLLTLHDPVRAAEPVVVRIVSTDFVLPAKFERLAEWAEAEGYRIEWRYADTLKDANVADGAVLLLLDGPRPGDRAAVEKAVGPLDRLAVPWLQIGGGPPAFGNLAPVAARRLMAYYAAGGEANLRAFVKAVPVALAGGDLAALPAPRALPATGLYHPAAPAPFVTPEAFREWAAARGTRPIVAIAISDGQIRDMQTAAIDALGKGIEARGLTPAFFWYDERDPQALTKVIKPLDAQAFVSFTHMQNGEARAAELRALDIPALQAVADRSGTPDQWRAATSGIGSTAATVMLAVPESWGVSDPIVVAAVEKGETVPIPEQVDLLAAKLARLVALRSKPAHDKHVALFFWNYPVGEKNLAASNLNLPQSLARLTHDMAAAGYDVSEKDEQAIIAAGQAMLAGYYRPETLDDLSARGMTARLPLTEYKAWFATLPSTLRQQITRRWGTPEKIPSLRGNTILIPRLALGKLLILPQPLRGDGSAEGYHDETVPPDHRYLATYLWVRTRGQADAIVHFGTHGTQEWTPGKDRGLWANDYPFLLVGDVPVFYPYIQDNVGEALQARRRGRAVTVSHQTPSFAPSGLYDELRDIHVLIHQYDQLDDGPTRDRVAGQIRAQAHAAHVGDDMGWDQAAIARDPEGYVSALQDHLFEIARTSIPMGLHVFGAPASEDRRLMTVMQQLGPDYLKALSLDPATTFAGDFTAIADSLPYRTLRRYLRDGEDIATIADPALRAQMERAAAYDRNLAEPGETQALLTGLAGRFVRPGPGGDPVRNPDVPSGRNLFAFEADKVPSQAAYAEGGKAMDRLIAAYQAKHGGAAPKRIAVTMFSGETIRTLGIGEGQILHALGLRPVWGRGGRVERLEIVPLAELGRPRIDVVVQPTSVYRDQFDGFMRLLADGIDRIAALDEPSGLAAYARALEKQLIGRGIAPERARDLSRLRIFTNAPGDYGTGLPERTAKGGNGGPGDWKSEADLAAPFVERMRFAYGARDWGLSLDGVNLFAEQLKGVDAAVVGRSSNLHGLVSTDHPFEHLGGLSLAIRSLTGKAPDLFVIDMRGTDTRVTTAGAFLSTELRARYLNPHWIGAMKEEGYAGANEMLGIVNNLWGWQVTDPASVRADQWQAMHDIYVRDARNLDLNRFFEKVHPSAQLQIVNRMIEAIRRDYWKADEATRRSLEQRRDALRPVVAAAERTTARTLAANGFGLAPAPPSAANAQAASVKSPLPPQPAREVKPAPPPSAPAGRILARQLPPPPAALPAVGGQIPALGAIFLLFLAGVLLEARGRRSLIREKVLHASA